MSATEVEQLRTILTGDITDLEAKLVTANRLLDDFASKPRNAPSIGGGATGGAGAIGGMSAQDIIAAGAARAAAIRAGIPAQTAAIDALSTATAAGLQKLQGLPGRILVPGAINIAKLQASTAQQVLSIDQLSTAQRTAILAKGAAQQATIADIAAAKTAATAATSQARVAAIDAQGMAQRVNLQAAAADKVLQIQAVGDARFLQQDAVYQAKRTAQQQLADDRINAMAVAAAQKRADFEAGRAIGMVGVAPTRTLADVASGLETRGMRNIRGGFYTSAVFTAPLVLGGIAVTKFAGEYQEAMTKVAALTDVGKEGIGAFHDQVLTLAKDPLIRQGPTALADALYYVTTNGLKGADAMEVLRQSAYGASAGLGETKDVAALTLKVMAAFGQNAQDSGHIMDVLTYAVKKGNGEATEYASVLGKVLPVAQQAGIGFEELAANIAVATRIMKPAEAATGLRQAMVAFIKPTQQARDAFHELGTSVEEMRVKMHTQGLFEVIRDLSTRPGADVQLPKIFGNIRALTEVLAVAGPQLKLYQDTLAGAFKAQGTVLTAASTASESFRFALDKLKSTAQATAIELGDRLLPKLTPLITTLGTDLPLAVEHFTNSWNNMSPAMQTATLRLVEFLAILGPLKIGLGTLDILAATLLRIGAVTGITGGLSGLGKAVGNFFSLLYSAGKGGGLGAVLGEAGEAASIAGIGTAAAAAALEVAALAAGLTLLAEVAGTVWFNYKAQLGELEIAHHNAAMAAEGMGKAIDKALHAAAKSPEVTGVLTDLKGKLGDAAKDGGRLLDVIKKLTEEKKAVELDSKLNEASKLLVLGEIDKLIREAESRAIELKVTVRQIGAAEEQPGSPTAGMTWQARAARAGVALPGAAPPALSTQGAFLDRDLAREWQKYNAEVSKAHGLIGQWEVAHLSATTNATAATTRNTHAYRVETDAVKDLTNAELEREEKRLAATVARQGADYKAGTRKIPADVSSEFQRLSDVEAEINKRTAADEAAKKRQAAADKLKAEQDAAAAKARAEEDARRLRALAAETAAKNAQTWNQFQNLVDQAAGGIEQMGNKTNAARIHAALMKDEFAGIPQELKASVYQLGVIQDRVERLVKVGDAFRSVFDQAFMGLTRAGMGTAGLAAQVNAVQSLLDVQGKINRLRTEGQTIQSNLASRAATESATYKAEAERLREENRGKAEVYNGNVPPVNPTIIPGVRGNVATAFLPPNFPSPDRIVRPFSVAAIRAAQRPVTPANAARQSLPPDADFSLVGRLLGVQAPPAAWGPLVTDRGMAPGESRQFQQMLQARLMDAKFMAEVEKEYRKNGRNLAAAIGAARKAVEMADLGESIGRIAIDTGQRLLGMESQIRLIGREHNPYDALAEEINHGAMNFLTKTADGRNIINRMIGTTLRSMGDTLRQQTTDFIREQNVQFAPLQAQMDTVGRLTPAGVDRAAFEAQKRAEIDNEPLMRAMREVGKGAIADEEAFKRLTAAMRLYDDQVIVTANRGYAELLRTQREEQRSLETESRLWHRVGANRAAVERAMVVDKARRDTLKQLEPLLSSSETPIAQLQENIRAANQAGTAAGTAYDTTAITAATQSQVEYNQSIADTIRLQSQQQVVLGNYKSYDPQLQLELSLLEERARLEKENRERPLAAQRSDMEISADVWKKRGELVSTANAEALKAYRQQVDGLDREMATLGDTTGLAGLKFDIAHGQLSLVADTAELVTRTLGKMRAEMQLSTEQGIAGDVSGYRSQFLQSNRAKLEEQIRLRETNERIRLSLPEAIPMTTAERDVIESQDARKRLAADAQDRRERAVQQLQAMRDLELQGVQTATRRVEIQNRYNGLIRDALNLTANEADLQRERDAAAQARLEDMTVRVRANGALLRDAISEGIHTGFDQGITEGLAAFGKRLRDAVLDNLINRFATRIGNRVTGSDMEVEQRVNPFGKVGGFDIQDYVRQHGFIGSDTRPGSDVWESVKGKAKESFGGGRNYQMPMENMAGALGAALSSQGIAAGSVTITTATARMDAVGATINAPGANINGAGSGLSDLFGGGSGSSPSFEQVISGFGPQGL